jgi:hypothetical protein
MIAPNFQRNTLREAADQVISHIRYTQHLAMMDDKFDADDPKWFRHRWQMVFSTSATYTNNKLSYTIFSDAATSIVGNADQYEMAINPLDNTKFLSGGYHGTLHTSNEKATKELNIGEEYGVNVFSLSGGCLNSRISFDYLGRPFQGNLANPASWHTAYQANKLIQSRCNVNLSNGVENIVIAIEPETGYTHIL